MLEHDQGFIINNSMYNHLEKCILRYVVRMIEQDQGFVTTHLQIMPRTNRGRTRQGLCNEAIRAQSYHRNNLEE